MKSLSISKFLETSNFSCFYPCDLTTDYFTVRSENGVFYLDFFNSLHERIYRLSVFPVSSRSSFISVSYLGNVRAQCFNVKQNFPFLFLKQTSLKMFMRSLELFALKVYSQDLY